jgi:hypothetical protein
VTPEALTNLINWVGVSTGVIGALVVAPSGPVELGRKGVELGRLIVAAARRVFWKKPGESVTARAGVATASAAVDTLVVRKQISEDAPIADQVALLAQFIGELREDLIKTRQELGAEVTKLREEIGRVEQSVHQTDKSIRQQITAAERKQADFNARGLPLIALSIVMTGPANLLAEWAWLAWLLIGLAGISVIFATWPWAAARVLR